jgi:helitron helicase-like protein
MSIARFYHKVDLFVTMITNPEWEEIRQQLFPGQTSYDRPDLVARVFKLKVAELLIDIVKHNVFGRVSAYLYVVEFQKRGLPHTHLLLILDSEHRIRSPSDIDSCVAAQWPNPDQQPLLFQTVKSCMIHGPCGTVSPNAPCMKKNGCSRGYPKALQENRSTTDDGYPSVRET